MTKQERGWLLPSAALCLALGILLGRVTEHWPIPVAACALALGAACLLQGRGRFFALLGLSLAAGAMAGTLAFHPALPPEGTCSVRGVLSDAPRIGTYGQVSVSLSDLTLDGHSFSGGAYWTWYTEDVPPDFQPGMEASFSARLYHPSGAVNPDGYDFRENLLRQGITIGLYGAEGLILSRPSFFSFSGWTAALRSRISVALFRYLGEESGAYASTLLLGVRSLISSEDRAAFSRLGIAHVLSVSGFHVGILISALALLFRLLRLPQRARLVLYALLLFFYSALCGWNQPVLRASLLTLLTLEGRILNRPRTGLHMLCASWVLLLLLSPAQLTGVSFQLSFGAMFGLVLVTPFFTRLLGHTPWIPRYFRDSLSLSLGAHLGVLLPELYWYQSLPLLSLLLNIPLTMVFSCLIAALWLFLLALPVPFLASLLSGPLTALITFLVNLIRRGGMLPGIALWTHASTLWTVFGVCLLFLGLCFFLPWRMRVRSLLTVCGLVTVTLSLLPQPHTGTEYIQFSVGNADAAVLWDQQQVYVLDTGLADGVVSGFLKRRRLTPDAVILTHLHSDHAAGLRSILDEGIPIHRCYLPVSAEDMLIDPDISDLIAELREKGTEICSLSRGDELPLPSGSLSVLWPEAGKVRPRQDANDYSLVSLFSLSGVTLLQTGDITAPFEDYSAVPADILKVAHHGSLSSTSEAFLSAVSPRAAILSCRFPERHAQTAERLGNIPLYSTAVSGALTLRFHQGICTIEPFIGSKR